MEVTLRNKVEAVRMLTHSIGYTGNPGQNVDGPSSPQLDANHDGVACDFNLIIHEILNRIKKEW
jgi:hypothetical protein